MRRPSRTKTQRSHAPGGNEQCARPAGPTTTQRATTQKRNGEGAADARPSVRPGSNHHTTPRHSWMRSPPNSAVTDNKTLQRGTLAAPPLHDGGQGTIGRRWRPLSGAGAPVPIHPSGRTCARVRACQQQRGSAFLSLVPVCHQAPHPHPGPSVHTCTFCHHRNPSPSVYPLRLPNLNHNSQPYVRARSPQRQAPDGRRRDWLAVGKKNHPPQTAPDTCQKPTTHATWRLSTHPRTKTLPAGHCRRHHAGCEWQLESLREGSSETRRPAGNSCQTPTASQPVTPT